jgi:hypothetical protein
MLVPSTRLKDRLNPNCPNCPSIPKKKMREEAAETLGVLSPPAVAIFLKTPGPGGTAGTDRHFNTLAEPATLYRPGRVGTARTDIASPSLGPQYLI